MFVMFYFVCPLVLAADWNFNFNSKLRRVLVILDGFIEWPHDFSSSAPFRTNFTFLASAVDIMKGNEGNVVVIIWTENSTVESIFLFYHSLCWIMCITVDKFKKVFKMYFQLNCCAPNKTQLQNNYMGLNIFFW